MAKVVLIVDSETGALIDVAGNRREDGRYFRFVKRLLSLDKNPILDYGVNGGDSLEISKGGSAGSSINLKANTVNVSGTLKAGGKTMQEIAVDQISTVLGMIKGKTGEVKVTTKVDQDTGKTYVEISLDSSLESRITSLEELVAGEAGDISSFVRKEDLAAALEGIAIRDEDTLEDVKAQFAALLRGLNALAGGGA